MILGIGMDLVDVGRIHHLLVRHPTRATARLFTAAERAYAERHAEPARHYAARFAAKEAAYKALAGSALARAISWQDVEVANEADGRPTLRLHGRAAERMAELGATRAWVTLTHADHVAGAPVVVEGEGRG